MQAIPTSPVPNQQLSVILANQAVTISLYQKQYGLFADIVLNGVPILFGVYCQNANRLIRSAYFNFVGDLAFWDTQGSADPVYTGLGTRWTLNYLETDDL